jgi:hypothetical protein
VAPGSPRCTSGRARRRGETARRAALGLAARRRPGELPLVGGQHLPLEAVAPAPARARSPSSLPPSRRPSIGCHADLYGMGAQTPRPASPHTFQTLCDITVHPIHVHMGWTDPKASSAAAGWRVRTPRSTARGLVGCGRPARAALRTSLQRFVVLSRHTRMARSDGTAKALYEDTFKCTCLRLFPPYFCPYNLAPMRSNNKAHMITAWYIVAGISLLFIF